MKEREAPAAKAGGSSSAKDQTQILPRELYVHFISKVPLIMLFPDCLLLLMCA